MLRKWQVGGQESGEPGGLWAKSIEALCGGMSAVINRVVLDLDVEMFIWGVVHVTLMGDCGFGFSGYPEELDALLSLCLTSSAVPRHRHLLTIDFSFLLRFHPLVTVEIP